jgi:hypothetical protein
MGSNIVQATQPAWKGHFRGIATFDPRQVDLAGTAPGTDERNVYLKELDTAFLICPLL